MSTPSTNAPNFKTPNITLFVKLSHRSVRRLWRRSLREGRGGGFCEGRRLPVRWDRIKPFPPPPGFSGKGKSFYKVTQGAPWFAGGKGNKELWGGKGPRQQPQGLRKRERKDVRFRWGTGSCHLFAFRTRSVVLGVFDRGFRCARGAGENLRLRWVFVSALPPLPSLLSE